MAEVISAREAKARIHDKRMCALLDVREEGQFGDGHPFLAVNCPYSHFEQLVSRLVPSTWVPTILVDDGDGVSIQAAELMALMGYTHVFCVEGGIPAWRAQGLNLYKGVNLPSKTLGEWVEHQENIHRITPTQLADWQSTRKPFHFFDCRPPNEYAKMTVPGAQCVPNGELAHRWAAVVKDDITPIVLTCAGRTRGLIGAAGLNRVGVGNPVYALENGTQGWTLAGLSLLRGQAPAELPVMDASHLSISRAKADALIDREQLLCIGVDEFTELARDQKRVVFLVDVRSAAEYAEGHLPGAIHAWGGQIVQAVDLFVGVRHATVVLTDDTGLRAAVAATWLRCLGYETFIMRDTQALSLSPRWRQMAPVPPIPAALPFVDLLHAAGLAQSGQVHLVDLRHSQAYRQLHITNAIWANRANLGRIPKDKPLILCADRPDVAQRVAQELQAMGHSVQGQIRSGVDTWRDAGLALASSPQVPTDDQCIDFLFFVHDRHDGNLESAKRYLEWEQGLMAQLDDEERAVFRLPPEPNTAQHAFTQQP
jgi:rhodanese-related sulfurtransferase